MSKVRLKIINAIDLDYYQTRAKINANCYLLQLQPPHDKRLYLSRPIFKVYLLLIIY